MKTPAIRVLKSMVEKLVYESNAKYVKESEAANAKAEAAFKKAQPSILKTLQKEFEENPSKFVTVGVSRYGYLNVEYGLLGDRHEELSAPYKVKDHAEDIEFAALNLSRVVRGEKACDKFKELAEKIDLAFLTEEASALADIIKNFKI